MVLSREHISANAQPPLIQSNQIQYQIKLYLDF